MSPAATIEKIYADYLRQELSIPVFAVNCISIHFCDFTWKILFWYFSYATP